MKKIIMQTILATALPAASGYAAVSNSAIAQLQEIHTSRAREFQLTIPGTLPEPQPADFPEMPTNATEDCYLANGIEVCIAPNWPACEENGDVEPCIDHVSPQYCNDGDVPLWLDFKAAGRWYQGCYARSTSPEIAGKIKMSPKGWKTALLGGGKKTSPAGGWADFLDNDPCGMACYAQANTALANWILAHAGEWPDDPGYEDK